VVVAVVVVAVAEAALGSYAHGVVSGNSSGISARTSVR
jgi:hypothetical protein